MPNYPETTLKNAKSSISNPKTAEKIKILLRELQEHPFTGTGKPEALKYQFRGAWSRRINHKDRLVYQVDGDIVTVIVLAMRYHYTK